MKGILTKMIKDLCFGDELLSQNLLISLITSPIIRKDDMISGHFPLNIKNADISV